jgi:aldose 1-epimerase
MTVNTLKEYQITTDFLKLTVLNYGAIITRLELTDKHGNPVNVVVGFDTPEDYFVNPDYLGASVGRYAGRINQGTFLVHGRRVQLDTEEGVHLHGGENGWSMKYWKLDECNYEAAEPYLRLRYDCAHSETGYPGNITAYVTYKLTRNHSLIIRYEARSDRDTVLNLTNHSYFNLSGKNKSINNHQLKIKASKYLEVTEKLIPTGTIMSLETSEKDFGKKRSIGSTRVDDTYILDITSKDQIEIKAPDTGISMHITTNQPAVVVYTPEDFPAICFETQNYPDAPNHDHFPSAELKSGDLYVNESVFRFSVTN